MSQTHTPGEWVVGPRGFGVVSIRPNGNPVTVVETPRTPSTHAKADIERIVLCCNAHDDLVAALRALLENNLGPQVDDGAEWDACCDMAKAALAKAGEK